MEGPTIVQAIDLRTKTVRQALSGGWGPPHTVIDLRGTPKGETAQRWTWSRLVLPLYGKRRVREHVEALYCAEGWHSDSGTADSPSDHVCHTIFDWVRRQDRDGFLAFHSQHPVVWRLNCHKGNTYWTRWFCDAELPTEYRPPAPA